MMSLIIFYHKKEIFSRRRELFFDNSVFLDNSLQLLYNNYIKHVLIRWYIITRIERIYVDDRNKQAGLHLKANENL